MARSHLQADVSVVHDIHFASKRLELRGQFVGERTVTLKYENLRGHSGLLNRLVQPHQKGCQPSGAPRISIQGECCQRTPGVWAILREETENCSVISVQSSFQPFESPSPPSEVKGASSCSARSSVSPSPGPPSEQPDNEGSKSQAFGQEVS